MTEDEYIKTKALGTITSAINTLSDVTPQIMLDIVPESEYFEVMQKLKIWQSRIFDQVQLKNNT